MEKIEQNKQVDKIPELSITDSDIMTALSCSPDDFQRLKEHVQKQEREAGEKGERRQERIIELVRNQIGKISPEIKAILEKDERTRIIQILLAIKDAVIATLKLDSLTGLLRRQIFLDEATKKISEKTEEVENFLIMIDLDHFKRINDEYGHLMGDRVLQEVGRILQTSIRPEDIAGRYGGEELGIFLSCNNQEEAYNVAERIRKTIEAAKIRMRIEGDTDYYEVKVTASLGVTSCHSGEDVSAIIHRADKALYEAKGSGRNQVVFSKREEQRQEK